ncbi:MAG TPA: hypothetical protein VIK45_09635 [Candidatus Dormibacteraeota bacterium]|jgi:hypothetical protein
MSGNQRESTRHYHLIDYAVGEPLSYRDEIFLRRREAETAARERAEWVAALQGLEVRALTGATRYLITSGHAGDAGRTIEIEECDSAECLELSYGPMC